MVDDASASPDPFDVRTVKILAALMSRHDLSEIDLCQGDMRIRLRRGSRLVTTSLPTAAAPVANAPAASTPTAAPAPTAEPAKPARPVQQIKSETIGTFYIAPNPGAPPFVRLGDRVTPTTVVGIIEAMKIFSEVQAGCNGVVTAILVENQQAVDFGTVLFEVDPTA